MTDNVNNSMYLYIAATISAPPTTNTPSTSDTSKGNTIATTGASSKIIHPSEDISLEEIRSRQPRYAKSIPTTRENSPSNSSNAASEVSEKQFFFKRQYHILFFLSQLAIAVSAAQQAAVNQAKHVEAMNQAAMMQRFPVRVSGPPITMAIPGGPVMAPMRHTMIQGPPTLIGGHLMRPPPISMPPGM